MQNDVVMGTLTVRENLMFSANLRLPNSLSQKDKRQRVEETLYELGLTSCADTKVSHILTYLLTYLLTCFTYLLYTLSLPVEQRPQITDLRHYSYYT